MPSCHKLKGSKSPYVHVPVTMFNTKNLFCGFQSGSDQKCVAFALPRSDQWIGFSKFSRQATHTSDVQLDAKMIV